MVGIQGTCHDLALALASRGGGGVAGWLPAHRSLSNARPVQRSCATPRPRPTCRPPALPSPRSGQPGSAAQHVAPLLRGLSADGKFCRAAWLTCLCMSLRFSAAGSNGAMPLRGACLRSRCMWATAATAPAPATCRPGRPRPDPNSSYSFGDAAAVLQDYMALPDNAMRSGPREVRAVVVGCCVAKFCQSRMGLSQALPAPRLAYRRATLQLKPCLLPPLPRRADDLPQPQGYARGHLYRGRHLPRCVPRCLAGLGGCQGCPAGHAEHEAARWL